MLTFAARPKSSVFGSHRTDFSLSRSSHPVEGEGGGGTSSRLRRLSFMMHSPRPAQSPDSDVSPMSSVPLKEVRPDTTQLDTKMDTKMDTMTDTKMDASPNTNMDTNKDCKMDADIDIDITPATTEPVTKLDTSVSYFPPPPVNVDMTQGSSEDVSPVDPRKFSISFPNDLPKPDHSPSDRTPTDAFSESSFGRKSSVSSLSFRRSRNPSVAPGIQKQTAHGLRIRNSSPPPERYVASCCRFLNFFCSFPCFGLHLTLYPLPTRPPLSVLHVPLLRPETGELLRNMMLQSE